MKQFIFILFLLSVCICSAQTADNKQNQSNPLLKSEVKENPNTNQIKKSENRPTENIVTPIVRYKSNDQDKSQTPENPKAEEMINPMVRVKNKTKEE